MTDPVLPDGDTWEAFLARRIRDRDELELRFMTALVTEYESVDREMRQVQHDINTAYAMVEEA